MEELIYRLGLKFSIYNFSIAFLFINYDIFSEILDVGFYNYQTLFVTRILVAFAISLILFLLLKKKCPFQKKNNPNF